MKPLTLNMLRNHAVLLLMEETFTHVRNAQHRAYVDLAELNADIRDTPANFFMYGGIIYPKTTPNGTPRPRNVMSPPLHYSLVQILDETNSMIEDAGWTRMKNYFIAIFGVSANGLVLKAFLPEILIAKLQKDLDAVGFKLIDHGPINVTVDPELTKESITNIKEHYADMAPALRELLMDKLLLQD
jgi:hypothetical protein